MRLALVLLIGCGGGDDAPGDATPDAPPEPVTLTVTRQTVPVPDVPVIFQRADSSVSEMVTTDANGLATGTPGVGGFVTAVTPFAAAVDVRTFVDVEPGAALVLDGGPSAATPEQRYTIRFAPVANAVFYKLGVRCPVGTGEFSAPATDPVELEIAVHCLAPTEILVVALDNLGDPISAAQHAEVTPTANGIVDMTGDAFAPVANTTFEVSNNLLSSLLEVTRVQGTAVFVADTEPADDGPHVLPLPVLPNGRQVAAMTTFGGSAVFAWGPASAGLSLDGDADATDDIEVAQIDLATSTLQWDASAPNANFAFGQLIVRGDAPYLWSYVAPLESNATEVQLPVLPGLMPLAEATVIDVEYAAGRVDARAELLRDGHWTDPSNGVTGRQRFLFSNPPSTPGTAGFAYVGGTVTP